MASIAQLLKEYSKESAEIEEVELNPEEDMSPLEDIAEIAELEDECLDEGGAVLEDEGDQIEEAVHTLVEANESLESSLNYLDAMREEHGTISDLGMRIFNSSIVDSMEARGIPTDVIFGGDVLSTEDASKEGTEKAKDGFFKRIWAMIRAAFQRMREWITRFFSWFRTSGGVVKKAAEKLKANAEEKKKAGAKADGKKYNQKPFTDLMVGGKVDPVKSIEVLVGARREVFASAGSLVDTSIKAIDDIKKEAAKAGKEKSLMQKLFSGLIIDSKRRYIKELASLMGKQSLATLPGGRTMQIKVEETKKGFRAKVTVVKPEHKGPVEDRWANVMSLDEIIKMSDNIINLVDGVEKATERFEKEFDKTKSFDNFVPKDDGASTPEVRELAALVSQGTAAARSIVSEFGGVVFPIAKRAYAAGVVNVRQYK